jgi:glutaconate CoA-transferase, subunit A
VRIQETATMMPNFKPISPGDIAGRIADGASIALAPDYSGCAMAAVAELIRRRARNLHLIGVPSLGLQADWLIGAGCVAVVEAAALTLGESGMPPRFLAAIKAGEIEMRDATCPAIHAGLQAAEKGIPFMPLRGILGSDLLKVRPDWRVIDNPLTAKGDRIVIIPAIRPDVALFHARHADARGNVWIGIRRELMLMAHAARETYVTVEEIIDGDFLADDAKAAGTIPALYISGIAHARRGGDPVGLAGAYPADYAALKDYVRAAQTASGFHDWMASHVLAGAPV